MLETYNVEILTSNVASVFTEIMQVMFYGIVILATIWMIVSLLIWLFGAKKKSEKAIKFGIRNFIVTVILQIVILVIPILIALMK